MTIKTKSLQTIGLVLLSLGFLGALSIVLSFQFIGLQYSGNWLMYLASPYIDLVFNLSKIFIIIGIVSILLSLVLKDKNK